MTPVFVATPEQEALIELTEGCYLVQAPPGTGKTQVLTQRIVRLLKSSPDSTFRILALTFTVKAAETLRKRVGDQVERAVVRVHATNFHSFCMDALHHYGNFVGFPADATVYDSEDDRLAVLAKALEQDGLAPLEEKELKQLLERIGVAKRALRPPEAVSDSYTSAAYAAYVGLLRRFHACDFDDLLWMTWRLMTESQKVAKHYRRRYRYIVIDEAQDTSRAQYEILRALCGDDHRNVMMVADEDQYIYRFAGASDRWLAAFVKDFGAERHNLVENFRCARMIVSLANKLVARQPGRNPRPLMASAKPALGAVQSVSFADESAEARGVADWVERLLSAGLNPSTLHASEDARVRAEDVCVLARNRYALDATIAEFKRRDIPFLFSAGRRLVETPEGQTLLQGLRIIQNPADRVTRESVLATWCPEQLDSGLAEIEPPNFFSRLGESSPEVRSLAELLASGAVATDVGGLVRALLNALQAIARAATEAPDEGSRLVALAGDIGTITERWTQYSGHTSPESRSIGGFLGEIALAGKSVIEGPGVRLLTVHVAKGLEFKAVALVGLNEGTLPDYRSLNRRDDLSDERRIAYVAVTRASRALLLTRPRARVMPWGDTKLQRESPFIDDMGLEMERR